MVTTGKKLEKQWCISAVNMSFLYFSGFYASVKGSGSFPEGSVLPCYCNSTQAIQNLNNHLI